MTDTRADPAAPPRGLLVDAALCVGVVLVVAAAITANLGGQRQPDAFAYLFAVGLGALMFVRRPLPILTLTATAVGIVAYYTAGYPAIGLAVPVAAALYSAAEVGRAGWALGTAVGLLVISSAFRVAEGDDLGYLFGYELASTVAVMAAAMALGDGVRSRRLWHAEQRQRIRRLELEREQEATRRVAEERLRIARELHDVLAHSMSVISLHSDVATEALPDDAPAALDALHHIRSASSEVGRELRATVGVLREDGERDPPRGLDQLDRLVGATTAGGLPVSVWVEGEPVALPAVVDATAYRIVQESLTNALRHSGACRAEVVLRYTSDRLDLRVTDDGRGDAGPGGTGHGVTGMRERAGLLGGTLQAGSLDGKGFEVRATLPAVLS